MTIVLSVCDARKRFGERVALDGASIELEAGGFVGLLGPNGAGKTTLVRAISGRARLDGGSVTLLGRRLDGSAADDRARHRLGVVPQELAVYPLLTARENLEVFASLHGVARADRAERVAWALEWTGLADRASDLAKTFSGGMKRRLNIACGVLHEPEVILLDEPTVGVDPQSRARIWEMLELLRTAGASLLLTTHQLDEAQQVCDRIVIIDHGRDIAAGTFDELVAATIGPERRVRVSLDGAAPAALIERGYEPGADGAVTRPVRDVAVELQAALAEIAAAGARVRDLHVDAPTLQAVFIHLTGRELRE